MQQFLSGGVLTVVEAGTDAGDGLLGTSGQVAVDRGPDGRALGLDLAHDRLTAAAVIDLGQ